MEKKYTTHREKKWKTQDKKIRTTKKLKEM